MCPVTLEYEVPYDTPRLLPPQPTPPLHNTPQRSWLSLSGPRATAHDLASAGIPFPILTEAGILPGLLREFPGPLAGEQGLLF